MSRCSNWVLSDVLIFSQFMGWKILGIIFIEDTSFYGCHEVTQNWIYLSVKFQEAPSSLIGTWMQGCSFETCISNHLQLLQWLLIIEKQRKKEGGHRKLTSMAKCSASVLRSLSRFRVSCKASYSITANCDTGKILEFCKCFFIVWCLGHSFPLPLRWYMECITSNH